LATPVKAIKALPIQLPDELDADLARDLPAKLAAGEGATALVADMNREGRCRLVEELFGVVVRKDDPEVRRHRFEPGADVGRCSLDAVNGAPIFGLGHREELRGVGQHGPADHTRHHWISNLRRHRPPVPTQGISRHPSRSCYRHRKSHRRPRNARCRILPTIRQALGRRKV
jgi:hypothetical protein